MRQTITIHCERMPAEVLAIVRGEFAIHPMHHRSAYVGCAAAWSVTHVRTGAAIVRRATAAQARHLVRDLVCLPVDWDLLFVSGNRQHTLPPADCERLFILFGHLGIELYQPEHAECQR